MIAARFVIDAEGTVHATSNGGSDLRDAALMTCVLGSFGELTFPAPEGGIVTVVSAVRLAPGKK